jgi:hypothetical protein
MPRGCRFLLTIERDPPVTDSDDEGRPVVGTVTRTDVMGGLAMLSATEARRAEHFGQGLIAAAHFPVGVDVKHTDRIIADPEKNQTHPRLPDQLAGTWIVGAVRFGRPLLRVLLRREQDP